jgi:hypothetical protein
MDDVVYTHYSPWLQLYEATVASPGYKYNYLGADGKLASRPIVDILAGCLASGVRFNASYFNKCVRTIDYYVRTSMDEIVDPDHYESRQKIIYLSAGYDEVLLLELYKSALRVSATRSRSEVTDLITYLGSNNAYRRMDRTDAIREMFVTDISSSRYRKIISKLSKLTTADDMIHYSKSHLCEYLADYMLFRYPLKPEFSTFIGNAASLINTPFSTELCDLVYKDIICIDAYNNLLDMFVAATDSLELRATMLSQKIECGAEPDTWMGQDVPKVDINDRCYMLGSKRAEYYVHTYDPTWIPEYFQDPEASGFYNETLHRCCKCISLSLCVEGGDYRDAIRATEQTVRNVDRWLPEFIVKCYLDNNIFDIIASQLRAGEQLDGTIASLKYIVSHPKVETYMYICQDGAQRQAFRFLPMIEQDVAFYTICDADRTVTVVDCYNIRKFESEFHDNYICMSYGAEPVIGNRHRHACQNLYEQTLNRPDYKYSLDHGQGRGMMSVIDIYVRMFTSAIKFNYWYFDMCVKKLSYYYRYVGDVHRSVSYDKLLMMTLFSTLRSDSEDLTEYVRDIIVVPQVVDQGRVSAIFSPGALARVEGIDLLKYVSDRADDIGYILADHPI